MFNSLTERLNSAFDAIRGRGVLSENDVSAVMREVRIALLEADVALPVVKEFIAYVKEKAIGQDVLKNVKPAQQIIKIVHDHLVDILGAETVELNLNAASPVPVMMVGLQGSGKTTSTAKIAKLLQDKHRKKVLMTSLDVYRPAAQEQLGVLGHDHNIPTLPIIQGQKPVDIAKRALETARLEGYDVLLLDTAGRLHIDDQLMDELCQIKSITNPAEVMLVADSMTGQDAVNVAKKFQEKVGITGISLTRIDGDARGGAALSMRQVTGCPIKFLGTGEQVDKIEVFHPDRVAGRILDMGDVVTLVEQAVEKIDQNEAEKLAKKMQSGKFDLGDMMKQLQQMGKMGGMSNIMNMMPGMQKLQDKMDGDGFDDKVIARQIAIIQSMTPKERKYDKLLNASRRRRIADGSGTSVQDINRLMKQFKQMQQMMKKVKKFGKAGLLRHGLKGLFS